MELKLAAGSFLEKGFGDHDRCLLPRSDLVTTCLPAQTDSRSLSGTDESLPGRVERLRLRCISLVIAHISNIISDDEHIKADCLPLMAASSLKSKRERCCSEDHHYQYPRAKSRDRQHVLCARFAVVVAMFSVIALVTTICVLAHQAQSRMIELPRGLQLKPQEDPRDFRVSSKNGF